VASTKVNIDHGDGPFGSNGYTSVRLSELIEPVNEIEMIDLVRFAWTTRAGPFGNQAFPIKECSSRDAQRCPGSGIIQLVTLGFIYHAIEEEFRMDDTRLPAYLVIRNGPTYLAEPVPGAEEANSNCRGGPDCLYYAVFSITIPLRDLPAISGELAKLEAVPSVDFKIPDHSEFLDAVARLSNAR
jgi:hypothetical protein